MQAQVRVRRAENYRHYEPQQQRSQGELPHLHVLRDKGAMAWLFAHWFTMIAGGWNDAGAATGSQCLLNRDGHGAWAGVIADRDDHLIVGCLNCIGGHHHVDLQHSGDQARRSSGIHDLEPAGRRW